MSDGEDGSEIPSAPEAEDSQAPAEPADEERKESRRPRLLPVWILLGAAAISGGAWAVMEYRGGGGPAPDDASVPLVTASAEAWKVRPEDPGGLEIPNQGTLIYETLTTADPEEGPERVLPPPEEPLRPPVPEADSAQEPPAGAPTGAESEAAPPPQMEEPAPAPVEETEPLEPAAPTEPVLVEEAPLPDPEVTEPLLVEEAPPPETVVIDFSGLEPPPPPKSQVFGVSGETGLPAPEAVIPDESGTRSEFEALVAEILETEAPADAESIFDPSQTADFPSVPIPVDKPGRLVRAEPPGQAPATTAFEPTPSISRVWRYVQLGTARDRSRLEAHWETLRSRHNDALVGLSPLIMPVDRGESGIFYRLRAGPLSDESAARRVCELLGQRGLECFVPRD